MSYVDPESGIEFPSYEDYERQRVAKWLAWSGGQYPDDSPGDVISAEWDGTIILDDSITTWNPLRALAFLEERHKQARANEGLALRGVSAEFAATTLELERVRDALRQLKRDSRTPQAIRYIVDDALNPEKEVKPPCRFCGEMTGNIVYASRTAGTRYEFIYYCKDNKRGCRDKAIEWTSELPF